jgi:uncharacterized membrane protein
MNLSFNHDWGLGSLLVVLAAMAIGVALFYRRAFQSGRDWRLWKLVALRTGALTLVLLLLYRPVLSIVRTQARRAELVVLVDTSGSMSVQDDPQGRSRLQQVQEVLLNHAGRLNQTFDVRILRFDAKATPLKQLSAVGSLRPTGGETNLAGALQTAVESGSKRRTTAVVVLTDGIDNSGRDVAAVAKELGVPVHTVAAGYNRAGSDSDRDVMISGVECPDRLPIKTQARIVAQIEARGLKGRVARVELVEKGAAIAERTVALDDARGVQRVELAFVPQTKGRHEYTVRIPRLSGERIEQNNRHSFSTMVVESRLRVLYVEGGIRAEYGALVGRYLAHDPAVAFLALVQTRPGLFIQRTNITDWKTTGIPADRDRLATFDVFIIGDLDSRFLGPQRMAVIEKLVSEGKGLLMIGGGHSFAGGGYANTPIGRLLPVDLTGGAANRPISDPFPLKLTAAGRRHAIFSGIADDFAGAGKKADVPTLPSLLGCSLLARPKPSAEVLAVHPNRGNEYGPLTVLAVQRVGKGRSAAFAADTTHRWYQVLRGLKEDSPYVRFWGQLIRWLAGKDKDEPLEPGLTVNTDKGYYRPGEPIALEAVLIGKDGRGVDSAQVEAVFETGPPADEPAVVTLERRSDRSGTYAGRHTPQQAGLYKVRVKAQSEGNELGAATLQVQVGNPTKEYGRLAVDEATLQAVADATGGRYVHIARAGRLFETLASEQREQQVLREQPLYNSPLFWLLFVGLITGEWMLRRKYRLR